MRPDPFRRVSGTLSETLQLDSISTMRHRWNGVGGGFLGWLVSLRKALWRKGFEGMVSSVPIRRQGLRQLWCQGRGVYFVDIDRLRESSNASGPDGANRCVVGLRCRGSRRRPGPTPASEPRTANTRLLQLIEGHAPNRSHHPVPEEATTGSTALHGDNVDIDRRDSVEISRLRHHRVLRHTHMQHSCRCIHVDRRRLYRSGPGVRWRRSTTGSSPSLDTAPAPRR